MILRLYNSASILIPLLVVAVIGWLPGMVTAQIATSQGETTEEQWIELKKGLKYVDLEEGEGEAARRTSWVQVHYTGWLEDGTRFQSSLDSGAAFAFQLGQGQVIQGWELGVVGMKRGGRRKLLIPAKLAYGRRGRPGVIPPNATLTFEIQLVSVR